MTEFDNKPTAIEEKLGYMFSDPEMLWEALTHSTYANENPVAAKNNERLEFVGDAVLDMLAAKLLYLLYPDAGEGELSRRRARVVRLDALAEQARNIELQKSLRVGRGVDEEMNSRLLGDAYEALVGAVYLDGGFDAVESTFGSIIHQAIERATKTLDFKTELQQLCHKAGDTPVYKVVRIQGPDHARTFTCSVLIDGEECGEGTDSSKKAAEQIAAKQALSSLGDKQERK